MTTAATTCISTNVSTIEIGAPGIVGGVNKESEYHGRHDSESQDRPPPSRQKSDGREHRRGSHRPNDRSEDNLLQA